LVVDHESFLAELVKLAVEAEGHACATAADLVAAGHILESTHVDLLALDLSGPGRDPFLWLEETILQHPDLHGRVFLLDASALSWDDSARAAACGARVLRKPFTLDQVRETVRAMIPASRRTADPRPRGPSLET
jgi:DNA-binding response OmpR family regulator